MKCYKKYCNAENILINTYGVKQKKYVSKIRKDASVLYPLAAFRNISDVG